MFTNLRPQGAYSFESIGGYSKIEVEFGSNDLVYK